MVLAILSPAAFLAAYVLVSFTATPNPMMALWRPLLVAIGIGFALQLVAGLVLRNRDRAALAASAGALLLSAAWVPLAVVSVAIAWLAGIYLLRRSRGEPLPASNARVVAGNLAVLAVAFAAVAAIPVLGWAFASAAAVPKDVPRGSPAGPDVVVLLMDAYPRADSLRDQFSVDNAPFEGELRERGFRVAAGSRSNYTSTWATLSSMFYGRPVNEIAVLNPPPQDPAEQYRRVMLALTGSPLLQDLRRNGYEIVTVPSPFESAALTHVDRVLEPPQLTSFELSLLQHSLLGQVAFRLTPDIAFDQHRAWLQTTLRLITDEVAHPSATPRFVFAHLLAPHPPVVYEADGSPAPPVACFPDCNIYGFSSTEDWARFPGQVAHVNRTVLDTIDEIISGDPDAIVILMSDHGSQRTGSASVYALRSFFAARVPDASMEFADDVTPMSVISTLAGNSVAATSRPYQAWVSAPLEPLSLTLYSGLEP